MNASIAEYLLRLARDADAAASHRSSDDAARGLMSDAGLSDEQQEIVLSRDPDRIAAAVRAELPPNGDGEDKGIPFLMVFMIMPPDGR